MAKKQRELSNYDAIVLCIEAALEELRTVTSLNILQYAKSYNLPYQRLNRAYKNGKNHKTQLKTNSLLTEQDYLLLRYIDFIDDIGFGVHHDLVLQQCDTILAASHIGVGSPPHCGVHWAQRWLRQHSQFRRVKAKPIEA